MTFRRFFPCLLVLTTLAALAWFQINAFSQIARPGNHPGIPQLGTTGVSNPPYQQPVPGSGFPNGGYANPMPGSVMPPATTLASTVPATTGAAQPGAQPNYMVNQPLGAIPNGPQPGAPLPVQNGRQIMPPPQGYQLTQKEWDEIIRFLTAWHEKSKEIEALDYDFICKESSAFGVSETYGQVKFRAPDKGLVEIHSELVNGKKITETNKKMKFVCTGEAVYEFNFVEKKLTEFIIPPEDRGKGVMDSPLMILVGANPRELHERFYLMLLDTPASMPNCICFQAWPKWVEDAREFQSVRVAIDRQTFHAQGLIVYDANGEGNKAYQITKTITNIRNKLANIILPKDEFARNTIVSSRPRDWTFESKTDFLPEASGQRLAKEQYPAVQPSPAPVTPQYGNQPFVPGPANNTMSPGIPGNPVPPQGQPGAMTQGTWPPGTLPGQAGYPGTPQNTVPQLLGVNPNTLPQQPNNSQMARPTQGNTAPPSVIR